MIAPMASGRCGLRTKAFGADIGLLRQKVGSTHQALLVVMNATEIQILGLRLRATGAGSMPGYATIAEWATAQLGNRPNSTTAAS